MTPHQKNLNKLLRGSSKTKNEDAFLFQLKTLGIATPETQYRFDNTRRWRVDFAWPDKRIAVEVEGGIWRRGGGAHSHPENIQRDIEKYNKLTMLGWRLLRVGPIELKSGEVARYVKQLLSEENHGEKYSYSIDSHIRSASITSGTC